jgi:hypothetical protein
VYAEQHRDVTRTNTFRHQQQGLGPFQHTRLGFRRTNGNLNLLPLLGPQRERLRSWARVRARYPRFRIDHAMPLPEAATSGQISAGRY